MAFRLVAVLATLQEHGHFSFDTLPGAQRLAHWETELVGQERDLERREIGLNQELADTTAIPADQLSSFIVFEKFFRFEISARTFVSID